MFAKTIFSIIIILSTATIGYVFAYGYVQRLHQLKNLYLSFQLLETEIIYASNPLPIAMKKVGERSHKTIRKIFTDVYDILHSKMGYSIEEVWNTAINNHFKQTSLNMEDKEILLDFGKSLGFADKENQIKNFKLIYLQLEKQQQIAEGLRMKNEKMCKSLGILVGIGIVIVFI
ncbi:stage III sporulation protein SpoIIIAB [Marinisporobacter balticus]|uniref:Stage III sporulation protein AB n=1 Tax=Marinisporobacter balticus TaxID=2018667 RepID=A0A4R2KZ37_9FIRM|nr:stage III sporulation protein SpoIIIAB [Marinisporobacter balticus]TCO79183.1 stage III sporulation protein AB [Marinisporobacter balticus]